MTAVMYACMYKYKKGATSTDKSTHPALIITEQSLDPLIQVQP